MYDILSKNIEQAWHERSLLEQFQTKMAINETISLLNSGKITVMEQNKNGNWQVNEWIKQGILLYFAINDGCHDYDGFPQAYDKIPLKFSNYQEQDFVSQGIRSVPGAIVRSGSFIGKNTVLMPCFVNIGAYVGHRTLIDTWATVGSCAHIGDNCHISGGVGIGGVLEPLQASPVIIEDNCFIGARSEVVEGAIIGQGSVIGMGVFISASTPIINQSTGEIHYGKVPPYSVVISGSMPSKHNKDINLNCAVIIKQVDEKTRSKTGINELLRHNQAISNDHAA